MLVSLVSPYTACNRPHNDLFCTLSLCNLITHSAFLWHNTYNVYTYVYTVALDLAFSSMYRDTVPVTVDRICPTVAAATMLQLVCRTFIYHYVSVCMYIYGLLGRIQSIESA